MKQQLLSLILALLLLLTVGSISVGAEDMSTVYVTISDDKGQLVLIQEPITVVDVDKDNKLTIHDTLYAAHNAKYEGGVDAGYASSTGQYGLQLDKLWGIVNGGSYGYYINNTSAVGLGDEIQNGDYLYAYAYTDLEAWSDTYCWFNTPTLKARCCEFVTLTLSAAGYDASWNPIVTPVVGATLVINGEKTTYTTDADGKVSLTIHTDMKTISAVSDTQILVPPACMVTIVDGETTETTDTPSSSAEVDGETIETTDTSSHSADSTSDNRNSAVETNDKTNQPDQTPAKLPVVPLAIGMIVILLVIVIVIVVLRRRKLS